MVIFVYTGITRQSNTAENSNGKERIHLAHFNSEKTPSIGSLALCYFLIYLAAMSVQGNWSYFTMYRFN
jgi:hypothetical protein